MLNVVLLRICTRLLKYIICAISFSHSLTHSFAGPFQCTTIGAAVVVVVFFVSILFFVFGLLHCKEFAHKVKSICVGTISLSLSPSRLLWQRNTQCQARVNQQRPNSILNVPLHLHLYFFWWCAYMCIYRCELWCCVSIERAFALMHVSRMYNARLHTHSHTLSYIHMHMFVSKQCKSPKYA